MKSVEEKWVASGEKAFRTDLNVMPSKLNIEQQMQKIDTDLGYDWNTRDQENSARIGVNWGLTASQLNAGMDPELLLRDRDISASCDFYRISDYL
ncbi:MAG: hypothetical protein ACLUBQ_09715 [Roseburia inulinivorans]